jgi:salicylate biosynthesis isochorismate synthase
MVGTIPPVLFDGRTLDALVLDLDGDATSWRAAAVPCRVDPLDLIRSGGRLFATAAFFSSPEGDAIAGLGEAARVSASGPDRLLHVAAGIARTPSTSTWFTGFSFSADGPRRREWDGFPAATGFLPLVTLERRRGVAMLTVNLPPGRSAAEVRGALGSLRMPVVPDAPEPGDHTVVSHPAPAEWRTEVEEAVAAIRAGAFGKVVLTRSVEVRADRPAEPFDLLFHLGASYPQCYAFGWQEGDAVFVGASPELLVSRRGDEVRANPLAGSAPRGEGEDEDESLGRSLMASAKDRVEHELVVDDIVARLGPVTTRLLVPATPSLKRMATVQHLSTEIRGVLDRPAHLLELADLLHPTPAVGGTPRGDAVGFIEKVEGIDRGWYTGGIGWSASSGDGVLALSLRCGLIRGDTAHLYAGAGIVADSNP